MFEEDGYFYRFQFLFYVPFRIAGKEPKWTEVTHKKRANTDGCHLRIFCKSRIFYNVSVNFGDCDFSPFLWNPIPIALFVLTYRSSRPMIPLYLCEHIMVSPRISCLRSIFPGCLQALACPPSARFGRPGFLDHFFCKHSIFSVFFIRFALTKN